jgi:ribonuclease-3
VAFTQGTYGNHKKTESYQRLEFLGDSIVKASLSEWLYKNINMDEGYYTKARTIMENNNFLTEIGKSLGLQKYVRHGDGFSKEDVLGVLDDVYESLVGCIFLQNGYKKTSKFVVKTCTKNFFDFDCIIYTSEVNEYFQKKYKSEYLKENHFEFTKGEGGKWECSIRDEGNRSIASSKNKKTAKEKACKDFYIRFINHK